jgi:hypothetical protein
MLDRGAGLARATLGGALGKLLRRFGEALLVTGRGVGDRGLRELTVVSDQEPDPVREGRVGEPALLALPELGELLRRFLLVLEDALAALGVEVAVVDPEGRGQ